MRSRTWKRVLAAVCAGVAAVSMAACGGGTNSTAKDGVIINRDGLCGSSLPHNGLPLHVQEDFETDYPTFHRFRRLVRRWHLAEARAIKDPVRRCAG